MRTSVAGKYEVIQKLGGGNYGEVFLVRHRDLGVRYAVKILNRTLSEDTRFIERFKREGEILTRFTHPGSVQLRDFGLTEDGLYYMAMDYVEGITLAALVDQCGRLPTTDALAIIIQILEVLVSAHAHGIVHRDIKPENIMLVMREGESAQIRILDFGIAKVKEEALANTQTVEGVTIGTPHYMSPEQAAGETALDYRVDIYAVGVVAYELLTGHVPFNGETVVQTLLMHLTRAPIPFAKALGIPDAVWAIVEKALAKNREERFQSVEEFLRAINSVLDTLDNTKKVGTALSVQRLPTSALPTEEPINPTTSGKATTKILCLDDNEMILNIVKHVLEREGFEVITTTDCSALHQHLFSGDVALLISDVQMPGIPGTRVCQLLKSAFEELKVVLFSSIPERDLEKLSIESKADGFISKSAKPDEWISKVKEVLSAAPKLIT